MRCAEYVRRAFNVIQHHGSPRSVVTSSFRVPRVPFRRTSSSWLAQCLQAVRDKLLPKMAPEDTAAGSALLELKTLRNMLRLSASGSVKEELRDVVFVCIDCEAFEFDQAKTTEVGISILDTRSIVDIPPGSDASAWFSSIQSEHFRIREYGHLVNKKFVKGCPDLFSFGTSTWVQKADASATVLRVFQYPASAGRVVPDATETPRSIVLVGHGLKNEVPYLQNLGFSLPSAPNVVSRFDTARLGGKKSGIGLGRLCKAVGLDSQSLHNAGNDAAYTLRAMLIAAVLDSTTAGGFPAFLRHAMAPEIAERELRARQRREAGPPRGQGRRGRHGPSSHRQDQSSTVLPDPAYILPPQSNLSRKSDEQ
ncbi:unnamed protein product [Zymoseptoria tritici ST99CH_1A5]|uniref:Gfd2/YDR514C-like C-terminal domain-containing protein n=1 Tax=Zymoseptoria tritici ST99CH_1A5 TaxID=1276529 RepID=A0A1Y6LHI0_ZYMTR|nr:unnamed protein product [Zymoseptoria tritici ST99CH_1A5]